MSLKYVTKETPVFQRRALISFSAANITNLGSVSETTMVGGTWKFPFLASLGTNPPSLDVSSPIGTSHSYATKWVKGGWENNKPYENSFFTEIMVWETPPLSCASRSGTVSMSHGITLTTLLFFYLHRLFKNKTKQILPSSNTAAGSLALRFKLPPSAYLPQVLLHHGWCESFHSLHFTFPK